MTISDDGPFEEILLPPEESLDEDELDDDPDEGYSPPERLLGVTSWGITAEEAAEHEDLDHRLAREEPDLDYMDYGDGIGDTFDTDGEPIDDQIGDVRSGRLVLGDIDESDRRSDYSAHDVGIDGGAASAEEAAVHLIKDEDGP